MLRNLKHSDAQAKLRDTLRGEERGATQRLTICGQHEAPARSIGAQARSTSAGRDTGSIEASTNVLREKAPREANHFAATPRTSYERNRGLLQSGEVAVRDIVAPLRRPIGGGDADMRRCPAATSRGRRQRRRFGKTPRQAKHTQHKWHEHTRCPRRGERANTTQYHVREWRGSWTAAGTAPGGWRRPPRPIDSCRERPLRENMQG